MKAIELETINQQNLISNNNKIRRSLWVDSLLWNKISNYINGQTIQGDYKYRNFSDFLRQALSLYQKKELKISRYRIAERRQAGVFIDSNTNNFYLSLPMLMRTQIINDCLNSLLTKEAQKNKS